MAELANHVEFSEFPIWRGDREVAVLGFRGESAPLQSLPRAHPREELLDRNCK